ncbi:MAG: T9SS type A sorting domain-containing protein [Ignavibacteria bacterium]|nr:T9SS type A sorting domain-containing protein [Ignavibacteria bacterium]
MPSSRTTLPLLLFSTALGAVLFHLSLQPVELNRQEIKAKPDHPGEAMKYYVLRHTGKPDGIIPTEYILAERQRFLKSGSMGKNTAVNWTEIGPDNIGGRTRGLLIDPSSHSILYAAAVGGGVWKSVNTGASWSSTTDNLGNIAFCCMAMAPGGTTTTRTIYAGTGEGFSNIDAIRGAGLYKTTNSGASWTQIATGTAMSYYINRIAVDPADANYVYVATNDGLFRSTNGGTSFASIGSFSNDVQDLALHPTSTDTLYTAVYANGVYKSANVKATTPTFTQIRTHSGQTRTEIALSPSKPSVLYACFANASYEPAFIEGSGNGGVDWITGTIPTNTDGALSSYMNTQGWYDNTIAVNPGNELLIYVGGVDSYKSSNGGATWAKMSSWQTLAAPYVHADIHEMQFQNDSTFYILCDGGVYRTSNWGGSWTDLNTGYNVTQFYYGSISNSGTVYIGGTQDNGTLKSTGGSTWTTIHGGDGGASIISHANSANMFCAYVFGALYYSTNSGSSWSTRSPPSAGGSNYLFIAPAEQSPSAAGTIVTGGWRVYRSTNSGSNWTNLYSLPSGGGLVSAIAISLTDDTLLVGTSTGKLYRSTNSGTAWAEVGPSGLGYVTDAEIAISNGNAAYITVSGYGSGGHVFKTTDLGAATPTWTDISSALPALPVLSVAIDRYDPAHLLIGSDAGVFESTNSGSAWVTVNGGFAAAASVEDIDVRYDGKAVAFTHGRGAFVTTNALPIELSGFDARRDGSAVALAWRTFSEENSLEFVVQRDEGSGWRALASIAAAGSSDRTLHYAWKDNAAPATALRYRLLQRDRDGASRLLPVRDVPALAAAATMVLYPNPVSAGRAVLLRLDRAPDTDAVIMIADATGRVVSRTGIGGLGSGGADLTLAVESLRPGVYYVSVHHGGTTLVSKLAILK